jgi:hypothetical protein|tara:strand:- start:3751 stop:4185 length:435 start_codon:yes stop_codon:yes gene_type:complete
MNPTISRILLIILLSISSLSYAKSLEDTDKVDKVSNFFMSQILSGDVPAAFALIATYLGVDAVSFEERGKKAELSLTQLNSSLGKPLSYALLEKQAVGDHFYKVIYLLKYETAALVWEINYYQPNAGWKLVDINFNTDINALFK